MTAPWHTPTRPGLGHFVAVPLLLALLAWQARRSGFDLAVSMAVFDPGSQTFPARREALLQLLGHEGARALPIAVGAGALATGVAGWYVERLRRWRAICLCLALSMVLGPLLVNRLKNIAGPHCPIDLTLFGGGVETAADLRSALWWGARARDGDCVPSGHAGGGYALLSLYFAGWAAGRPAWRWGGLAIGIAAGLAFSAVRVLQGAHFPSQTIWSAALTWLVATVVFTPLLAGWIGGRLAPHARGLSADADRTPGSKRRDQPSGGPDSTM